MGTSRCRPRLTSSIRTRARSPPSASASTSRRPLRGAEGGFARRVARTVERLCMSPVDLVEQALRSRWVGVECECDYKLQLDRERHEVLLDAIVKKALDRAALGIGVEDAAASRDARNSSASRWRSSSDSGQPACHVHLSFITPRSRQAARRPSPERHASTPPDGNRLPAPSRARTQGPSRRQGSKQWKVTMSKQTLS